MGTPIGTTFTDEHKTNLLASRRKSKKWREGRKRAAAKMRGRKPSIEAMAGSLATRFVRNAGLTRATAPTLWANYLEHYIARLRRLEGLAAAA